MSDEQLWLPQWERVDLGGPHGALYTNETNIKILWHTWEGTNWGAAESSFAPYPPHCGAKIFDRVRQYVPLNRHAYALLGSRNEGEFVIQIEVAGFAHNSRNMSYEEKEWLAKNVLEPILFFFPNVPDTHPPFYDDQDGFTLASPNSRIRFSFANWVTYSGHVGHQHAPAPDDHWDPGRLDLDTIIRIARDAGNQHPRKLEEKVYALVRGDGPVGTMAKPGPGSYWYITDYISASHVISAQSANERLFEIRKNGGVIICADNNQPLVWPQAEVDALIKA